LLRCGTNMAIDHPWARLTGGQWLRGNLHAYTNNSDGERKSFFIRK